MRVQFEFTQDDLIDASKRFSARLKAVRSFQWTGLLATSFLTWLLVFVFLYRTPVQGAIIGLMAAAISAALFPRSNRRTVEKRMRKVAREIFGDANSFLCEVELRPDGVWVRSMNRQTLFEWASEEEVKETSDSVDIFTREGSGVVCATEHSHRPRSDRDSSNWQERESIQHTTQPLLAHRLRT